MSELFLSVPASIQWEKVYGEEGMVIHEGDTSVFMQHRDGSGMLFRCLCTCLCLSADRRRDYDSHLEVAKTLETILPDTDNGFPACGNLLCCL